MEAFAFWLDKPFDPRRARKQGRRGTRTVVLRYTGSIGRSAVKALVVFALLAILTSVIGDRAGLDLDAREVASTAGLAAPRG
jgi:hypothetical protein